MNGFKMLPTPPGTCPECAVVHDQNEPHDKRSLAYQYSFYAKRGRWPTWTDAMAHVTPDVREAWVSNLKALKLWNDEEETKPKVPDVCPTEDETIGTVTTIPIQHPKRKRKS
jgi:hypothetical protein